MKKIVRFLNNPYRILARIVKGRFYFLPDKVYLNIVYRASFGKSINWKDPQTYNEKLQWLKINDRKSIYSRMVDKYEAKEYVANIIGRNHIIPTLAVCDTFDDIDFKNLPDKFVIKTTHDSGTVIICKDKKTFDYKNAKKIINRSLNHNFYYWGREWPYKNVKPRIIIEKYMEDETSKELKDYKWFCFNGVPKAMFIATDRFTPNTDTKFDFYDMNFRHLPFTNGHPNVDGAEILKPEGFDEMKNLAAKLSKNIPQVRVDFYVINGDIYFGELTFFHWSGFVPFKPEKWDYTFGSWISLPQEENSIVL